MADARAALALGAALAAAPVQADPLERFGTAMKYALPAAGAVCAARQDRLEDYAMRGALQAGLVLGAKRYFDGQPVSQRPAGGGEGFPSGHSAAAFFGAADLAGKCFDDQPEAGAVAYGAAGLTALSRVRARAHTPVQVTTGAAIGFSFGAADFGIGTEGASFSVGLKF